MTKKKSIGPNGNQINYLRFKDFLVQLGLLSELSSMQADSKERGLLFDMWRILKGDANDFVYTEDMRVLVQVILRLIDPKRVLNVNILNQQEV
jgi:hypothetical protein